jgi:hypothetical protein
MDVLEYFRLDEEPFRLSPSPRFLYLNDQVKQATAKVTFMTKHRTVVHLWCDWFGQDQHFTSAL